MATHFARAQTPNYVSDTKSAITFSSVQLSGSVEDLRNTGTSITAVSVALRFWFSLSATTTGTFRFWMYALWGTGTSTSAFPSVSFSTRGDEAKAYLWLQTTFTSLPVASGTSYYSNTRTIATKARYMKLWAFCQGPAQSGTFVFMHAPRFLKRVPGV